jgi:toxin-antitoxin system PIN domain toxin
MILVDVNLLLYAVNQDLPEHERARLWWERTLSGVEAVLIPWVVLLAFLRISTNPRVFPAPLQVEQALRYVHEWLSAPTVKPVSPGEGHWPLLAQILQTTGAAGNLTTDVHIAALAIEKGATVYSADNDFKRFVGVRHVNPLHPPAGLQ